MKFNDVVSYTRNGVTMNALVKASRDLPEHGELLTLLYQDEQGNPQTAFDIKPLAEGAMNGWRNERSVVDVVKAQILSRIGDEITSARTHLTEEEFSTFCKLKEKMAIQESQKTPAHTPVEQLVPHETKNYVDGRSATGPAPLPSMSPDEQRATEMKAAAAAEVKPESTEVPIPAGTHEKPGEPGTLIKDGTEDESAEPKPDETIH